VVRGPLGCSLCLSSSFGGLRNRAGSLYRFALTDGPCGARWLLPAAPPKRPRHKTRAVATVACGLILLPIACLLVATSMPQQNETAATNGTDGTIYFWLKLEFRYLVFATDENAGMLRPSADGRSMTVWGFRGQFPWPRHLFTPFSPARIRV
jgi:hypothetical protein